ncbi:MAG: OmpH family outer membrane protein [Candidatus Fermentibacteraceae bacterium]|nr:OmpH family outer membrane protein [Candidatus Fermentibacteraceae bacterium]
MRLLVVLAFPALLAAQTIAVFDSDQVFESLGEVADARELLETEMDQWELHVDSLQEEIDVLEEDLSRTLMMSPERRQEKEALLEEKKIQIESYLSSVFGPDGLMERRNEELVNPIISAINEAVIDIASEEGIQLVLDASAGQVVYAEASVDITDQVIDRVMSGND